ncbi:MAG: hypothetical protein HY246_01870 [Proteobacteria bacterium]|nr:hypothetical protein [Pseudomonadota bacterium]
MRKLPPSGKCQPRDAARRRFTAMLRRVETEADRNGTLTARRVLREMDKIIAAKKR